MKTEAMKRLLATILAEQPERADAAHALDEERLRRALSGAEPLTAAEQHLLWTSPAARRQLYALREAQRARQYLAWQRQGVTTEILCLAAADAAIQPLTITTHPDVTVKLFPLDAQGVRWTLALQVSAALCQTLLGGVRLVDSGGVQWLAGYVDEDGALSADWAHEESPLRRLEHYALQLEPL